MLKKLILLLTLLTMTVAQAQFSKYKAKTRFNRNGLNVEKVDDDDQDDQDDQDDEENSKKSLVPPKRKYISSRRNNNDENENKADRSRSKRNKPPVRSLLNKVANERSEQSRQDQFGRKVAKPSVSPDQEKVYVNLNPETAFGPEVITSFDFPNADIGELIKHMQQLTGINMIYDKNLRGKSKISISAPTPITVGDAWRAFLTALNMNDMSLIKTGAFYKIVPTSKIKDSPSKIYTGSFSPDTENFVMRIIPLKNINGKEVRRSLRQFLTRQGKISSIDQTNTVIVQDIGTNVNRIARLIKFIDIPGHDENMEIIPVRHSSASELAKLLEQLIQDKSSSKFRSSSPVRSSSTQKNNANIRKIIAETRTNSIIAMANAAGAKKLRTLIAQLDVEVVASGAGKIHVYYLNHSDAEEMAKSLSTLVSGSGSSSRSSSRSSKFSRGSTDSTENLFNDSVKITADKSNNALVITASPTDYLTIKDVIAKLDVPKDQVYVEGIIMETQIDKSHSFGISIIGAYGTGSTQRAGFTGGSSDLIDLITGNITNLGGLFIGSGAGKSIVDEKTGTTIKSVNGLISAIAANTNSNVLATPQILALDNEEAVFEVGETVPVSEKTDAANGSSTTSIKQQKVALVLKITPQINKQSRVIKLKIDQKIDDFSNRPVESNSGVATTTRAAVTTVLCKDQDTIAMGGLMRDKTVNTQSKVPLLGDLPLVGWLFRHTSKAVSKVNMLFFLTPRIISINDSSSAEKVKDLLNRRNTHLKGVLEGKDPHEPMIKGLYNKNEQKLNNGFLED